MSNELQTVSPERESAFSNNAGFKNAMEIAKMLSSSELVPTTYRGKPANCIIALDIARTVGNSPLVVMQNLYIIQGKPSWSSTYIAGTIRARYKNIKIEMSGTGMDRSCRVVAYDDDGKVIAEGATVTMKMAAEEGWLNKNGSKWKTMPELMLQYRANAFFGRVHCPDALIGIKSEYESKDISKTIDVTPPARDPLADPLAVAKEEMKEEKKKETQAMRPERTAWEEEDERKEAEANKKASDGPAPEPPAQSKKITDAQRGRLYAISTNNGYTQDEVKAHIKAYFKFGSTKDITADKYDEIVKRFETKKGDE